MTGFFDALASLSLRALASCLQRLPLQTAVRLGRFTGGIVFYFSNRRRVAYADLKAALGNRFTERERWKIIREHYGHLGQTAAEILFFPRVNHEVIKRYMKVDHEERVYQVLEEKRGVIFLAGHFGNWELSQIVTGTFGKPIHVLARSQKHTLLNQLLNELRESRGSVSVSRGMGVRDLMRALRRNEFIGLLGDQDAGKEGGIILSFFGRKTTVPTGAYEIAARTGAAILPAFFVRNEGPRHTLHIGEPIRCNQNSEDNTNHESPARTYLKILEDFITRFPSQWLWGSKRWKYSWTKRILILSDGKPGHVKQSEAVCAQLQKFKTQFDRPGVEYPTTRLEVKFKSEWHRKIFPVFAFFFIPWAQGRLRSLRFFFDPETQRRLLETSADFVISAGSSLVPLNLCLAKDSRAKTIVMMKPSFPFNLFRYDLLVVPAHDQGIVPDRAFRVLLTPSRTEECDFANAAEKIRKDLRDPSRIKAAVFLGGSAHHFVMDLERIEKIFASIERAAKRIGDYVVTTSRRTPPSVESFLKATLARHPSCQLLVLASEDKRSEVAAGMMALAEILIVTEDSISMISEAVASGKKVIVVTFDSEGLPKKHRRFKEMLVRQSAVVTARPEELEEKMRELMHCEMPPLFKTEQEALQSRLQAIL